MESASVRLCDFCGVVKLATLACQCAPNCKVLQYVRYKAQLIRLTTADRSCACRAFLTGYLGQGHITEPFRVVFLHGGGLAPIGAFYAVNLLCASAHAPAPGLDSGLTAAASIHAREMSV